MTDSAFIKDRFEKLLQNGNWTHTTIAKRLNLARPTVKKVIEGDISTPTTRDVFNKILEFLQIDETLFFGKNSPVVVKNSPGWDGDRIAGIPIYGEIPAGTLHLVEPDSIIGLVPMTDLDPEKYFAVRVRGASMEPDFKDGDTAICRRVEGISLPNKNEGPTHINRFTRFEGRVVCALVDQESTLKRLEISRTGADAADYIINLRPLNPNHPTISVGGKNTFDIQGEVVRLVRNI